MNTKTTLPTVSEIVTAVLTAIEAIVAGTTRPAIIFNNVLGDPRDQALANAIYDLLDDTSPEGRAQRVEAANVLLDEFSDGAKTYAVRYDDLAAEIHRAAAVLPRPGDQEDAFGRIMRRGYAEAMGTRAPSAGRLVDVLA